MLVRERSSPHSQRPGGSAFPCALDGPEAPKPTGMMERKLMMQVRIGLATNEVPDRLPDAPACVGDPAPLIDRLRRKLGNLVDGHASSPRNADGSPRPSPDNPADYETPEPPLSDADWADHHDLVDRRLDHARIVGLETHKHYALAPRYDKWTPERNRLHAAILDDIYRKTADVPCEHRAIMAGGLPGAGKTTVLKEQAGIELSRYLMVNPDDFKVELARRGMLPKVPCLSPMEAASLAHDSSAIADLCPACPPVA